MAEETNEIVTEAAQDPGISDIRRPMVEGAAAAARHDSAPTETHHADDSHAEFLSDTTTVFGRTVTVEGGIYTVVFGFLAAATVLEVAVGSLPRGAILIPILLGIAVIKAALVVMYYMHLKTDSRLFTYILLVPTVIAGAALLYLLSVPTTGY
jgi:caa(3)-type oxidase subunit IV